MKGARMSWHQRKYVAYIRRHKGCKLDAIVRSCTSNPKADPHQVEGTVVSGLHGLLRRGLIDHRNGRFYPPSKKRKLNRVVKLAAMADKMLRMLDKDDHDARALVENFKRDLRYIRKDEFGYEPIHTDRRINDPPGKIWRPA